MVARIDVHYVVPTGGQTITSNYNGAGNVTVTVAAGRYRSLALLCAQVQTQLQTINGSYTCVQAAGRVTIAAGATFTLVWPVLTLRDWLGYTGGKSGAATYSGDVLSPGTWVAALPWWHASPLGWEYRIKRWGGPYQQGGSTLIGSVTVWEFGASVTRDELAQARLVLGHLCRGLACRLWQDTAVSAAWSSAQWYGYLDLVLHPSQQDYTERWRRSDLARLADLDLKCQEFTG